MRLGTDIGNFVMLILAACVAGVLLGDWAFKAVLFLGVVGMVIGLVAYYRKAFPAPRNSATSHRDAAQATRSADEGVLALLDAVSAKDEKSIESLVLRDNVSPFQNAAWRGSHTSANALAETMRYMPATTFFREWGAKGNAARFVKTPSQSVNSSKEG